MNITEKRTQIIIDALVNRYDASLCDHYGEPGYRDPEKQIVFANWNYIPSNLSEYIEDAGYSIEWSDEWLINGSDNKAYRTKPDSHDWEPSYSITNDGEIITIHDTADDWIDHAMVLSHVQEVMHSVPSAVDLIDNDSDLYFIDEKYSIGFGGGDDAPVEIAKHFLGLSGVSGIVFQLNGSSMFSQDYVVWLKIENIDAICDELKESVCY